MMSQVWIKNRVQSNNHFIFDSLRGILNYINSDLTQVEQYISIANSLTDFNTNGFTIGAYTSINTNLETYIVWQKSYNKVKITTTSQGKRAIVAYDTEAGRSMTLFQGSGLASHAIPTGLLVPSEFGVVKNLDAISDWSAQLVGTSRMVLNTSGAGLGSSLWSSTSGIINLEANSSDWNTTNLNYIMYSEASVPGQIKIDTYTGTGAVGNYVDLGDEPEYVMIKNVTAIGSWRILDTTRPTGTLYADSSAIEATSTTYSVTKKGFILNETDTDTNTTGQTYLYIAYASGSKTSKVLPNETTTATGVTSTKSTVFDAKAYAGTGAVQDIITGIPSVDFTVAFNGSGYYHDRVAGDGIVKTDAGVVVDSGECLVNLSKVHIKSRSVIHGHSVSDGLRGSGAFIGIDTTSVEALLNVNAVSAYLLTGFTLDTGIYTNEVSTTYLAYQNQYTHLRWGITNHNKRYIESYNPVSGEGMVMYVGSGSAGHQIPHSQEVEINIGMTKNLSNITDWVLDGHVKSERLIVNSTVASASTTYANSYTKDYIVTGTLNNTHNTSNDSYICYYKTKSSTWTNGTYIGTGVTGNYVETRDSNGVPRKPARVVVKSISAIGDWDVVDNKRLDNTLSLNTSSIETSEDMLDISSTGFVLKSTTINNASGATYYYEVYFDNDATGEGSKVTTYEGTISTANAPTDYVNLNDSKLEFTLDNQATWFQASVSSFSLVNGSLTSNYSTISDLKPNNRDIKARLTIRPDGRSVTQISADIWKVSEV